MLAYFFENPKFIKRNSCKQVGMAYLVEEFREVYFKKILNIPNVAI